MMTLHFGWPQAIWVLLAVLRLVDCTIHHGEPDGKKSAYWSLVGIAIGVLLLWWGGFFGPWER